MHYFVSDIHLGSGDKGEQRRVERLFLDFLSKIEADAESLYLVWISWRISDSPEVILVSGSTHIAPSAIHCPVFAAVFIRS